MSQARRERRKAQRDNKVKGKLMNQFIGLKKEQSALEQQFADTFKEYGLDPYGKDSEQFQQALLTHKVK
jgi:hypothetical protein